jgi:hypothetical protein
MTLSDKIVSLTTARGKHLVLGAAAFNCEMRDDSDGRGPYITAWSVAELGAVPTQADGFTADELRAEIRTVLPSTPQPPGLDPKWDWGPTFVEVMGEG